MTKYLVLLKIILSRLSTKGMAEVYTWLSVNVFKLNKVIRFFFLLANDKNNKSHITKYLELFKIISSRHYSLKGLAKVYTYISHAVIES